jgi:hypothetical protein
MNKPENKSTELPIEVAMVERVKNCIDCKWFWGAIQPYGPFPVYDWKQEEFPNAIKHGPPSSDDDKPVFWCKVEQTGAQAVEPAILRGCRKAPIMTIGINPNMTAFFASAKSASWVYPWFSREQTYAYYYRHATIYQESFSLDTLKASIIPGTEIFAEDAGMVKIERCNSHRWMHFAFHYQGRDAPVHLERAWKPEQRLVVFNDGFSTDRDQLFGISKGDLIAAQIQPDNSGKAELFANKTGYYARLQPALQRFTDYLNDNGFTHCQPAMGEDVSMHDMVGCASPGWGTNLDIPRERIADNCVNKNRYMIDQLLQSRPKLVFIVSNSSLAMFADGFSKAGGHIALDFENRDIFDLLQETCKQRRTITLNAGKETFKSRLIVTPHFSYAANFEQQSRFRTDAWEIFCHQYPTDAELLNKENRIFIRKDEAFMSIMVQRKDDDIKNKISAAAWQLLMDYHYDPYTLISDALIEEQQTYPLITDKKASHLDRAPGGCSFCVNEKWTFTEGCDYGLA